MYEPLKKRGGFCLTVRVGASAHQKKKKKKKKGESLRSPKIGKEKWPTMSAIGGIGSRSEKGGDTRGQLSIVRKHWGGKKGERRAIEFSLPSVQELCLKGGGNKGRTAVFFLLLSRWGIGQQGKRKKRRRLLSRGRGGKGKGGSTYASRPGVRRLRPREGRTFIRQVEAIGAALDQKNLEKKKKKRTFSRSGRKRRNRANFSSGRARDR